MQGKQCFLLNLYFSLACYLCRTPKCWGLVSVQHSTKITRSNLGLYFVRSSNKSRDQSMEGTASFVVLCSEIKHLWQDLHWETSPDISDVFSNKDINFLFVCFLLSLTIFFFWQFLLSQWRNADKVWPGLCCSADLCMWPLQGGGFCLPCKCCGFLILWLSC